MNRWMAALLAWVAIGVACGTVQPALAAGETKGSTVQEASVTLTGVVEVIMEEAVKGEDYLIQGNSLVSGDGEPVRYDPSSGKYTMQKRYLVVREGRDEEGKAITGMEGRRVRIHFKDAGQIDALAGQAVEAKGILRQGKRLEATAVSRTTDLPSRFTCDCKPDCDYSLSMSNATLSADRTRLTVAVTAKGDAACAAPAVVTSHDWMKGSLTAWKNNKGTLEVDVAGNESSAQRTGTIGAGKKISVTQRGSPCRTGDITPPAAPFAADGGTGTIVVTTWPADCGWSLIPRAPWIRIAKAKGHGNETVEYSVEPNRGKTARKGAITIQAGRDRKAGRDIPVRQDGPGNR